MDTATGMTAMNMSKRNATRRRAEVRGPQQRASKDGGGDMLRGPRLARPPQNDGERKQGGLDQAALYRLLVWLSPSYPVGAFSYSSGLEWAVECKDVNDTDTLRTWLGSVISEGGIFCDAVFFAHAHRAITENDRGKLRSIAELAAAFTPSKERQLETMAQGQAFLQMTRAAWPTPALDLLTAAWDGPVAYPVAIATAAAGHGIALEAALQAYLQAVAANLISAGIRLIPLGQTDGQRVLA